jgi:hypothetical protein
MQSGTSLYLAIIIMVILLAIALGLTTIFLGQMAIVREMGYSVIAFYAADAGIEEVLMDRGSPSDIPETVLADESTYQVFVTTGGTGDCTAPYFCIKSIGTYKEVNRSIEIMY